MVDLRKEDLPAGLLAIRPSDLEELQRNNDILQSIRDILPDSQHARGAIIDKAEIAIKTTDRLKHEIEDLELVRAEVIKLQKQEIEAKKEWYKCEKSMNDAIELFTTDGIRKEITRQTEDLQTLITGIEHDFTSNTNMSYEESARLAKKYVEINKELLLLEEIRKSL